VTPGLGLRWYPVVTYLTPGTFSLNWIGALGISLTSQVMTRTLFLRSSDLPRDGCPHSGPWKARNSHCTNCLSQVYVEICWQESTEQQTHSSQKFMRSLDSVSCHSSCAGLNEDVLTISAACDSNEWGGSITQTTHSSQLLDCEM